MKIYITYLSKWPKWRKSISLPISSPIATSASPRTATACWVDKSFAAASALAAAASSTIETTKCLSVSAHFQIFEYKWFFDAINHRVEVVYNIFTFFLFLFFFFVVLTAWISSVTLIFFEWYIIFFSGFMMLTEMELHRIVKFEICINIIQQVLYRG